MAAIAPASTADLLDLLKKSNVLPATRLKALPEPDALPADPRKAATVLVQKGFITKFQGTQLLAGRHKGFRIGPYAVLDILGRGGMGAVYLGEHLELNRKVAIKVLAPVRGEGQQLAAERFQREARAAAALDHPNIVRVFDVARHLDTPYLVMEYVDGETLQQMLDRDGAVSPEVAAEYIAQAAAGLQHAHERGFIHRDIKPGNLIRDRFGVVKVLDMGLARNGSDEDKLTEQLDEGAVVGTADFISPEQAINSPNIDGRADLYSLGATLFTLLAGKTPFEGNTTQKLMQHQLKDAPTLAALKPALPAALTRVVARMLAKKADDRYQTGAEVVAALAPWTGASARVVAAMSRTNLGQSLARRDGSSSSALLQSGPPSPDESGVVDPCEAASTTAEIRAAETVRNRPAVEDEPVEDESPTPKPRRRMLTVGVGAALIVALGVGGWLAFGRDKPTETVKNTEPEAPTPAPPVDPKPIEPAPVLPKPITPKPVDPKPIDKVPPKVVPAPGERVLYQLDMNGANPFVIRSVNSVDPADATKKIAKVLSRSGAGLPPAGWQGRAFGTNAEMEFFSDATDGRFALGIRNTSGPPSAMLFTPTFLSPTGLCRLKFEYQARVQNRKFVLRFKPSDTRKAWDIAHPAPSGDGWRTAEFVVDLKGAPGGFFEFHNTDDQTNAVVRIRACTVTEAPVGTAPTPVASPAPAGPDYRNWTEGKSVYALDVEKVAVFRVTKEKSMRTAGTAEKLPAGVGCQAWKEGGIGEFRRDTFEGFPALGITNLNDVKSSQFTFLLEGALKVALKPGTAYRLKVSYRTAGDAAGTTTLHLTPPYKSVGTAQLTNSNSQWKTATVNFVRPAAEDKVEMRLLIENTTVGEGNTLWVKSVEIVELNPPKK